MNIRVTKDFRFEAAHKLVNIPKEHKCAKTHGHTFIVEISVEGKVDPETGWYYDHAEITKAMEPLISILDHSELNTVNGLENPTIEMLSVWIWKRLEQVLPGLVQVVVHETPNVRCTYQGK